MKTYRTALSIAGSDCSGGAGIQADIKTMSAFGVYAMTAITAITVQNTLGVTDVQGIRPDIVAGQIDAVYRDIRPDAVKIGMLFSPDIVAAVADALERNKARNIVLDPVMIATSGDPLIDDEAIELIKRRLLPMSRIITPNVNEARALSGTDDTALQIKALRALGAHDILLKGGDKSSDSGTSTDYLSLEGSDNIMRLSNERVNTANTHGTGCTLSSAIASCLALGMSMRDSVIAAKEYISAALRNGADVTIGHGHGPVNHLFEPRRLEPTNPI
ncbi:MULTISPECIES: bifunctional hydroxymethylpyrimidine kinase/phosphomethylpyrimidine kinase [Muribaculum]|uniref:bifunctional hydroxymethylpyrimidine kinase/phosphomethylpyrimidine kinase n=2 Tax=Muribaculaceae TaxID=2005473 RepID=UPI00248BB6E3|nr:MULTISPECIES: bifunctional hydroxymethylpyrimidine kinase/phosphomethylpyrimidine kinase [Muribaculum]MCX4276348.1 bifunctional hydroxymethylpyrimidine kinase/phosphomethylpyrimidine kinase [Muribaculum sp.]